MPFGRPSRFGNGWRGLGGRNAASAASMSSAHSAGASGTRRGASGVAATVDPDDLSGDVAGFVPHQVRARRSDVFGPAHAPHWRLRGVELDALAQETLLLR